MMPNSNTPTIISAVVAPAILILASSSLITTTANRLSLLLDRIRHLTADMEAWTAGRLGADAKKKEYIVAQLGKGSRRAGLLQRALATLYLALASLILTSVCIGIGAVSGLNANFIGATVLASISFLFYASTLLLRESRIALASVNEEMDYVRRLIA